MIDKICHYVKSGNFQGLILYKHNQKTKPVTSQNILKYVLKYSIQYDSITEPNIFRFIYQVI